MNMRGWSFISGMLLKTPRFSARVAVMNRQKSMKTEAESEKTLSKEEYKNRRLDALKDVVMYPHKFNVSTSVISYKSQFLDLTPGSALPDQTHEIAGIITSVRESSKKLKFIDVESGGEKLQLKVDAKSYSSLEDFRRDTDVLRRGDRIGASGHPARTKAGELSLVPSKLTLLAPCLRQLPSARLGLENNDKRFRRRHVDFLANPEVRQIFVTRNKIIRFIRGYLEDLDFLEVETPILGCSVGGAAARPFVTHHNAMDLPLFLRVAPELYLKRLVIGGFDRVFEIGKLFRNEGVDSSHNPEFTSCEFYMAYADYNDLMLLTENLLSGLESSLHNARDETVFGKTFHRLEFIPALESATGKTFPSPDQLNTEDSAKFLADLCKLKEVQAGEGAGQMMDKLMSHLIEPELVEPTFVTHHPIIMSPLAKPHRDKLGVAERFELFVAGKEIVNAYTELNDPEAQRKAFSEQAGLDGEDVMIPDKDYCQALEYGLPPTAGWGCGIDRLAMLLTGNKNIRETILFPLLRPR